MRKKCIQCCNNFSIRAVPLGLDHTKNNSNVSVCCEVGTEICYILLHSLLWVIPRRLECYVPTFRNNLFHPHRWVKQEVHEVEQSGPKRRFIKFRRRGITQNKEQDIQKTANVCFVCMNFRIRIFKCLKRLIILKMIRIFKLSFLLQHAELLTIYDYYTVCGWRNGLKYGG